MTLTKGRLAQFLCAAWVALAAVPAFGQLALNSLPARGQFRDAVADTERGRLLLAVYDVDAVWSIDPPTGKATTKIPVGDGPVALATDGQFLAVVNRLDNSVTLINMADLSIAAKVETGDGPSAIESLGNGRFLVTNTFSDSLSLIETRGTISVSTLETCPPVPVDLAVTDDHVVIVGRGDATAVVLDRASLAVAHRVTFPERVVHAASSASGLTAVASSSALYVVDAAAGRITRSVKTAVSSVGISNDLVHVASGDTLKTFDGTLNPISTQQLESALPLVSCSGSVVILLDPAEQKAWSSGLTALAKSEAPDAESPEAPVEKPVVVVEASAPAEVKASDPVEPMIVEAAPAETATPVEPTAPEKTEQAQVEEVAPPVEEDGSETPAPAEEPINEPQPPSEVAQETAPTEQAAPQSPKTPTPAPGGNFQRNPIQTGGVRAPSLNQPSASPLQQLSQSTITDALIRPTEFGSTEGGFQAPDLTKNLENITFDNASKAAGSDTMDFTNFRAELGDLTLTTKALSHQKAPVEIHASGDVLITQQDSSVTADEIKFRIDETGSETEPRVLEGGEDGSALDKGHLTLRNAHIIEPTREMTADYLDYDFATGKGELENAKGQAGIYYFSAEKLHLHGPQSLSGENVWVTTCDHAHPHYKIRLSDLELVDGQPVAGSNARLQLGNADTPLYLPKWRRGSVGGSPWTLDFDSGRQAEIGYYVNLGQAYELSPDVALGPRIFATEKEGVGLGLDLSYDFFENPASRLYRTRGEAHGLYTTEDRGYIHWYHRYEYSNDLVVRAQLEHWGDEDFYQDFYYDLYRNRSLPRSFVNVTYRQPSYIATGTVRLQTHGWFSETEQLPEATFHLLERPLAENLYFTFDTANGYYNREPYGVDGGRSANTARLTYSWDPHPALAITPYWELDANFYSRDRLNRDASGNFSSTAGVTAQTRLHRTYGGRWGFSAFKHVIVPSITYSYRSSTSIDPPELPQYDPLDSLFGRSRIESKLSNIFYGRDAETGQVWQVGRITLYQGNDLQNDTRKTEDYEIEIDVRPRPWWGVQVVGERQVTANEDSSLNRYSFARNFPGVYNAINEFVGRDEADDFSNSYGDYNRILSQIYYDGAPRGGRVSGRVGFAYTETRSEVFNREVLYGLGYKLSDKWGFGFEHIYDFEGGDLRSQAYELRRSLHCWETAIRFRDRESGFDINFEFNIKAFPGSRIKF